MIDTTKDGEDTRQKASEEQAQFACNVRLCYLCKKETISLSADPSWWPLELEYVGGNGKKRTYHRGCVSRLIAAAKVTQEKIDTFTSTLTLLNTLMMF